MKTIDEILNRNDYQRMTVHAQGACSGNRSQNAPKACGIGLGGRGSRCCIERHEWMQC